MKSVILLFLFCSLPLPALPYRGRVIYKNATPIIGVTASVVSKDSTILSMSITDNLAIILLTKQIFPVTIRIRPLGVKTKDTLLARNPEQLLKLSSIMTFHSSSQRLTERNCYNNLIYT